MSRLHTVYMTELHPHLLAVMAGYKASEFNQYFNLQCKLQFEPQYNPNHKADHAPFEDVTRLVFPMYDEYIDRFENSPVDPGVSARNFVYKLLPFLAQVVVQDGVFWIRQWPDHPVSNLLHAQLPNSYSRIARCC
jgi:hypothetical protein